MSPWTLIPHVAGKGTWLLHRRQLQHSICQYWESNIRNLALIALFLKKKYKIFSNTACNHVSELKLLLENGAITPPPVSRAPHLAKAQIHWFKRKKKPKNDV